MIRHGKTHEGQPAPSAAAASTRAIPEAADPSNLDTSGAASATEQSTALPTESFLDDMLIQDPAIDPNLLAGEDLGFDQHLQWPETENLLQSIISTDFNWLPLNSLPFPAPDAIPAVTPGSIAISESEGHSTHRAVHDLSSLINSLPSKVAVDVEGLTSSFIDQ